MIATALTVLLAGCGVSSIGSSGPGSTEVLEDVQYYYACGNEVLELPDEPQTYDFVC